MALCTIPGTTHFQMTKHIIKLLLFTWVSPLLLATNHAPLEPFTTLEIGQAVATLY